MFVPGKGVAAFLFAFVSARIFASRPYGVFG